MSMSEPTPLQRDQLKIIAQTRLTYGIDGAGFVQYGGTYWHYLGPGHKSLGNRWLQWDRTQVVLYSPYMGVVVAAPIEEVYVTWMKQPAPPAGPTHGSSVA